MATITVSDLDFSPAGLDFFLDSESYISGLSDDDLALINGGLGPVAWAVITGTILITSGGVGFSIGYTTRGKL